MKVEVTTWEKLNCHYVAKLSKDLMVIECKDIDEIITKSEILEAVPSQSVDEANVLQFREAYCDTK